MLKLLSSDMMMHIGLLQEKQLMSDTHQRQQTEAVIVQAEESTKLQIVKASECVSVCDLKFLLALTSYHQSVFYLSAAYW